MGSMDLLIFFAHQGNTLSDLWKSSDDIAIKRRGAEREQKGQERKPHVCACSIPMDLDQQEMKWEACTC
jgi:hypothetical protein